MNEVRTALYDYGDVAELARQVEVAASTLYAIRCGRTAWPRPSTLFRMLPALGLELRIARIRNR